MPAPVFLAALGALLVSLDSSLNIALPAVAADFGIGPEAVRWMIICYVATYALTAFGAGMLGDRIGAARVFTVGSWLSAIVFAAYAVTPSFAAALACRIAQGITGGLIYGTASALVTQSLPRERHGRGLGIMSLGLGAGVAVGPVLGGLLVDTFGWRSVFLYRAPLAAALGAAALAMAPRSRPEGTSSPRSLAFRDVARLDVLVPGLLTFLSSSAQFSIWLLIPFYLVSSQALSATAGGVLFALSPLGTALASPVSGWAADRLGTRWPIVIGLAVEMAGLAIISRLAADSSLILVVVGLLCVGLGVGIFQVANLAQMMAAFPRTQQGVAGGLAFLARALGSAAGVQVSATLFGARVAAVGFMAAFQGAFLGAAVVAGVAAALALGSALGRGRRRRVAL